VVGRVQNNNYERDGETVYTMAFTAEEIDYLDTKAEGEAIRAKQGSAPDDGASVPDAKPAPRASSTKPTRSRKATAKAPAAEETDDIPFWRRRAGRSTFRPFTSIPLIEGTDMYSTPTLATRFARNTRLLRADAPLSEDQMRSAAPSVFAEGKHASRSDRYTYIPTIDVLRGLRKEGFEPFMVAQGRSRVEGKAEFTKHMIRMRHAGHVSTKSEANEIILIIAIALRGQLVARQRASTKRRSLMLQRERQRDFALQSVVNSSPGSSSSLPHRCVADFKIREPDGRPNSVQCVALQVTLLK
jgi:hypothetical protein